MFRITDRVGSHRSPVSPNLAIRLDRVPSGELQPDFHPAPSVYPIATGPVTSLQSYPLQALPTFPTGILGISQRTSVARHPATRALPFKGRFSGRVAEHSCSVLRGLLDSRASLWAAFGRVAIDLRSLRTGVPVPHVLAVTTPI